MVYASRRCQVDPIFGMAAVFWIGCITGVFGGRYHSTTSLDMALHSKRALQPFGQEDKRINALPFLADAGRP